MEIIQALMSLAKDITNALTEHPEAAGVLLLAYLKGKYR